MTYAEYINEEFEKYAKTSKAIAIKGQVMKYAKEKYQRYLMGGNSSRRANEKVIDELQSSIKQKFPKIITLPRKGVVDDIISNKKIIKILVIFMIFTIPIYLFAPILAFIPQLIVITMAKSISIELPKEVNPKIKKYFFGRFCLIIFVFQAIMMSIKYPPWEYEGGASLYFIYPFMILFMTFLSWVMTLREYKYKEQGVIMTLIDGPRFRFVESYIFLVYLFASIASFVFHIFILFLDTLFATW